MHWASDVPDDWPAVLAELTRAFQLSRRAAQDAESMVFVVHQDDLLGRRGSANAIVACALLSAARTAALEGGHQGWTANVVAFDEESDRSAVEEWAGKLLESGEVNGELIRVGPGHIGKTLA